MIKNSNHLSVIFILFLCIVVFLGWTTVFDIDETIRARGQVIPSAKNQLVQSADGGVLAELLVHEGQHIEEGQLLATFEPERPKAAVSELNSRMAAIKSALVRARAEARGSPLDFGAEFDEYQGLVSTQTELYKQKLATLFTELDTLKSVLDTANDELAVNQQLLQSGDISVLEVSRSKRQVREIVGKIEASKQKYRQDARLEIVKLEEDLAQIHSKLQERVSVLDHTRVTSPASGIVKSLRINTIGGVLRAGDEILQISPTEGGVIVEAKINPSDIGRLLIGHIAVIRLDAYDYSSYSSLTGKVVHISSDTLTDQAGANGQVSTYYRVNIRFDDPDIQSNLLLKNMEIKPGMTSTIDIMVGRRSLFEYIFKPFAKAFRGALSER